MASQFATIYLKEKTTIPVPEVLHLDINFDNSVGAPYTLQKRVRIVFCVDSKLNAF
ncbi:hypothetical protein BDP27DRAFT_1312101 [Rhodocollybia butyracea]|uniref:Uncharacterized protein n=1 Tax=Rhodocollybia butyracea TaxID=206335 RepID=A0A9P5Q8J6_9AGAR|nr:hypothetical protein BDP27DRAFT_1312101 [Rhodocollybia butyracea]